MPMPSDAEILEAMGAERLDGPTDAVLAQIAARHALITIRLAIAAERIADALEKAGPPENVRYFFPWPRRTTAHPGGMG
jgi:hypothetical protein